MLFIEIVDERVDVSGAIENLLFLLKDAFLDLADAGGSEVVENDEAAEVVEASEKVFEASDETSDKGVEVLNEKLEEAIEARNEVSGKGW